MSIYVCSSNGNSSRLRLQLDVSNTSMKEITCPSLSRITRLSFSGPITHSSVSQFASRKLVHNSTVSDLSLQKIYKKQLDGATTCGPYIPRVPDFVRGQNDPLRKTPVIRRIAHPSAQRVGPLEEEGGLDNKCALKWERHHFVDPERYAEIEGVLKVPQRNLQHKNIFSNVGSVYKYIFV